VHEVA